MSSDTADPTPAGDSAAQQHEDDGLEVLRAFGLRRTLSAGATLFRQGEIPELLFVVERGEVELWDESRDERRLLQRVGAGASIGELPVLLGEPALYTATAGGEVELLAFSRTMVHDLLDVDPQVCFVWMRVLSQRLRRSYPQHVVVAGRSAVERVARFLLTEVEGDRDANIELTQTQLASATGLSRQTVSGVLESFERLRVLERGRGSIRVLDTNRLRALLPR